MRAELIVLPDGSERLLLVIHHLVVDGVSWRILLEDLATAYGAGEARATRRRAGPDQLGPAMGRRAGGAGPDDTGVDWWKAQLSGPVAALPGERDAEPASTVTRHSSPRRSTGR